MSRNEEIIDQLQSLVDVGKCKVDADTLLQFGRDWTKVYEPAPLAVMFPTSVQQVEAIVGFANRHALALVPSGGRTGLSGGAMAPNGEVVVAFDYMNAISDFNAVDRTVRCQAGVITEQLQQFAAENGLFYPVDFASSGSSQIGGNIATNAGGIKVIRYGMTRDWVASLTVVTGEGETLYLNKGLTKNATGYDFRHLFIGAEGTLGFIVEATIRLTRPPKQLSVLVLGVPNFTAIMSVMNTFQQKIELTAFEFFSDKALGYVVAHGDVQRPFEGEAPLYVLIEYEARTEQDQVDVMALFENAVEQGWVTDGVMSQSESQAKSLWRLREDISEAISIFTPYKNDISVCVSKVPAFLNEVDTVVGRHYPDFDIVWFGHIGDGNVHLNILKPDNLSKDDFFRQCARVSQWVFEIVQRYGGSVSAEHGVGLIKKDYLGYTRSKTEINYMRAMKKVFDPNGVMNPGKIFDQ